MQINHIANIDMKQLRQETLLRKYVCHICLRQMRLINKQLCKITTGKTQKCTYVKTAQKKKKKKKNVKKKKKKKKKKKNLFTCCKLHNNQLTGNV